MTGPVDTVIHGTLVNVHTGRFEAGAVAIDNGEIVALENRPAKRRLEAEYIAPGLIDSHMHVESSMITVGRYGEAVVPRGVAGVVHDPHEIGNVLGPAGVQALLDDAAQTPLKVRFTVPSSVPASPLQDNGGTIDPEDVRQLLTATHVVALGEVMNIPGVIAGEADIHAKIQAAREQGLTVDGHLPRVTGSDLQEAARYLDTDHESINLAEAREKADAGIAVALREGSSSKNLKNLAQLVDQVDTRMLSLCTDDRDVTDLIDNGGIDDVLRTAIEEGVDPMEAVQMATINVAKRYDLSFGRLQPGVPADLVLLSDLERWEVKHVMLDGVLDPTTEAELTHSTALATETMLCEPITVDQLVHPAPETDALQARVRVIDAVGGIQTARMEGAVPVTESGLAANREDDILPLAVIDRHRPAGTTGTGFVHRLGLSRGAIATTVAHDAHNLVVAGVTHEAMETVANHLREIGGGIAAYDPATEKLSSLALPVAGLLSDQPLESVGEDYRTVESTADQIGLVDTGLLRLTFLALEVIPEYRLTNRGLVDVDQMAYVDVVL